MQLKHRHSGKTSSCSSRRETAINSSGAVSSSWWQMSLMYWKGMNGSSMQTSMCEEGEQAGYSRGWRGQ